jgi:hypothetical protein
MAAAATTTTTTTTMTTTPALLRSLERDFTGKRSVQDCFRRVKIPAAQVKKLLDDVNHNRSSKTPDNVVVVLDQQAFRLSFCSLLTENLGVAKNAYSHSQQQQQGEMKKDDGESSDSCRSFRSMWYISKLSTVFHFMQLLWEYEGKANKPATATTTTSVQDENGDTENDDLHAANRRRPNSACSVSSAESCNNKRSAGIATSSSTTNALAPEQANKWILQLLRSIAGVAGTLCEKHHEQAQNGAAAASTIVEEDNDDNDANNNHNSACENDEDDFYTSNNAAQSFHGLQVAAFVLMNLIRLNHYVRFRPVFISPLWRAIGDVVTAMQPMTTTTTIPRDIWVQGVTCLTEYLLEGTVPTLRLFVDATTACDLDRVELQQQHEQQQFQTKVLGFLLGRLLVFCKVLRVLPTRQRERHQVHEEEILSKLLHILCILRGVDHAQLAGKVDRCIKAMLPSFVMTASDDDGSSCNHAQPQLQQQQQQQQQQFQNVAQRLMQSSHNRAIQVLLQQADGAANAVGRSDNIEPINLAIPCYFQGHCWLLLQPLQVALEAITASFTTMKKGDGDGDNKRANAASLSSLDKTRFLLQHAETLFRVMERVLFCALPACSQDLWTTTSASLVVDNKNDSSARAAANKSSLKHLLLPCCMSLCQQLLLGYESSLCCRSSSDDPWQQRRQALHHLLASWLGRAEHPLAREIVLVLVHGHIHNLLRALKGDTTIGAATTAAAEPLVRLLAKLLFDQRTKLKLRRNLASLFVRLLGQDASLQPQQVKFFAEAILVDELDKSSHLGTTTTTTALSTSNKHKRTRCKSSSSSSNKSFTAADMMVLGQVIEILPSDDSSRGFLAQRLQDGLEPKLLGPVTVALLRSDAVSAEASTIRDLVVKFSKLWSTPRNTQFKKENATAGTRGADSSSNLTSLGVALFRYLHKSCLKSAELQPQQAIVLIQAICRVFRCILESSDNGQQQSLAVAVIMEGIRVLQVVSRGLSCNTQSAMMEQLGRIFHQLLSHKEWTVRAHAMSSLVVFASTVPTAHKQVLPSCLPINMASLLQCRLKGTAAPSDGLSMQHQCAQKMFSLVQFDAGIVSPFGGDSVFPTISSSVVIPAGSLVVKMPIYQDNGAAGRTALVIFPPGEQSMEDIAYMQNANENPHTIEKMHRMQSVPGGYKMILRE